MGQLNNKKGHDNNWVPPGVSFRFGRIEAPMEEFIAAKKAMDLEPMLSGVDSSAATSASSLAIERGRIGEVGSGVACSCLGVSLLRCESRIGFERIPLGSKKWVSLCLRTPACLGCFKDKPKGTNYHFERHG